MLLLIQAVFYTLFFRTLFKIIFSIRFFFVIYSFFFYPLKQLQLSVLEEKKNPHRLPGGGQIASLLNGMIA